MHGAQGGQDDAVLSFIVGGATSVNPVVDLGCPPWIEIVAPLTLIPSTTSPCPYIRTVGAEEFSQVSASRKGLLLVGDLINRVEKQSSENAGFNSSSR